MTLAEPLLKLQIFGIVFHLLEWQLPNFSHAEPENKKAELSFLFLYFPVKALLFSMIINKTIFHFILNSQLFVILYHGLSNYLVL